MNNLNDCFQDSISRILSSTEAINNSSFYIPTELKRDLIAFVCSVIEYPNPVANTKNNAQMERWHCEIESESPCAFHDESYWDNYSIDIFDQNPLSMNDDTTINENYNKKLDAYLKKYDYHVYGSQRQSIEDMPFWAYQSIITTFVRVNNPDPLLHGKMGTLWIRITENCGCF